VRAEGVEPTRATEGSTDFRTVYGFRRPGGALPGAGAGFAVWTIPSPSPGEFRGLGAARLVSTPSRTEHSVRAWLGIAIAGFPEFGQFCIAGFPASTQACLKSVASAIPPRPRGRSSIACIIGQSARIWLVILRRACFGPLRVLGRLWFRLRYTPHDVDRGGVETGLDVSRVVLLDHLDAGAAVFRDLAPPSDGNRCTYAGGYRTCVAGPRGRSASFVRRVSS
jgi:hypothetical protein